MIRPHVTSLFIAFLLLAALPAPSTAAEAKVVQVKDDAGLRDALAGAQPGWRIVVAAGKYRPGVSGDRLRGTQADPIVIEAADPKNKPVFDGGKVGLHFRDCVYLTLRNLAVRGASGNGINIDDGGTADTPAHHITLEGVEVSDIGPKGNTDAIKVSGVDDFVLRNCRIEGWGGEGIDMVGCHRGLIEGCSFIGKQGFSQAIGVQAKGGSSQVTVRRCSFRNAGQRGVNLGGSTGKEYFRPKDAKYEAKDITVEGCRFAGSLTPVAYVGVDGVTVRYNTIYQPEKWALRILQENTSEGMVPSRNGVFEHNLVIYRRESVRLVVNIGPNTEPVSFTFRENWWYAQDDPAHSRPDLPAAEQGGVYGTDPNVPVGTDGMPGTPATDNAKGFGADALPAKP